MMVAHEDENSGRDFSPAEPELRDLLIFSAGKHSFGIFTDEVDGTGENKRPAVLPFAPVAVLGVVAVRGRMLTAVDPVALITGEPFEWRSELPWLIALRGDEQLALAAEDLGETVTIAMSDVESAGSSQTNDVVTGISRHAGHEITILKSSSLFAAAVQRRERRRRRF